MYLNWIDIAQVFWLAKTASRVVRELIVNPPSLSLHLPLPCPGMRIITPEGD